jgi:hypothetical protein
VATPRTATVLLQTSPTVTSVQVILVAERLAPPGFVGVRGGLTQEITTILCDQKDFLIFFDANLTVLC